LRCLFDIETNGLYEQVNRIHCVVARDIDTEEEHVFGPDRINDALEFLSSADLLAGHNIARFDIPVIEKLYPGVKLTSLLLDTFAISRMMFISNLRLMDIAKNMEKRMIGSHSLESWGVRLGAHKGDYHKNANWSRFTDDMLQYCRQDVVVNVKLLDYLTNYKPSGYSDRFSFESMVAESKVTRILHIQELHGVGFNAPDAARLYGDLLQKREDIRRELQDIFKPVFIQKGEFTPKVCNRKLGYAPGGTLSKIQLQEFNPSSNAQIAKRLTENYGWVPKEFTPEGQPKVDERTLASLDYKPVETLLNYKLLDKRIGQVAEGSNAWLKLEDGGVIHGAVHTTGARTGRSSHFKPNLAQVPSVGSLYGKECRDLFGPVHEDSFLVGIDASGLELRMLANRLHNYDKGSFTEEILSGDPHIAFMKGTGIKDRSTQKTWTYAFLYGAGLYKLGTIVVKDRQLRNNSGTRVPESQIPKLGSASRKALIEKIPSLGKLLSACKKAHDRGWIKLLDGRIVESVSQHSSINTLLQGDGAVVMKWAQVRLHERLVESGLSGWNWCLTVHDEWQIEVATEEMGEHVGLEAVDALRWAGETLGVRCPLDGEYKIGKTWGDTH